MHSAPGTTAGLLSTNAGSSKAFRVNFRQRMRGQPINKTFGRSEQQICHQPKPCSNTFVVCIAVLYIYIRVLCRRHESSCKD